jgi:SAM-dependent methyltransferase
MIFPRYAQAIGSSRMGHSGDLDTARSIYLKGKNPNLNWLIKSRFTWMNKFIARESEGIELGAGFAPSKDFIKARRFLVSDFNDFDWLDLKHINALDTGLKSESFDFVIASNTIHHLAFPEKFLNETARILKPNGVLIIQDIYTSLIMRILLKVMRHEGFNENIDVFSKLIACNDKNDPWSANCSIPRLLFKSLDRFNQEFPIWEIIHYKNVECLQFINSGGVIAKTHYIKFGPKMLKVQDRIDQVLCRFLPEIFSLQIQIVLKKNR